MCHVGAAAVNVCFYDTHAANVSADLCRSSQGRRSGSAFLTSETATSAGTVRLEEVF